MPSQRSETYVIPYTVFPFRGDKWKWKHDITEKVSVKSYDTKEAAITAAQAAFMQSRQEDHFGWGKEEARHAD